MDAARSRGAMPDMRAPDAAYVLQWSLTRASRAQLGGHLFMALAMRIQGVFGCDVALEDHLWEALAAFLRNSAGLVRAEVRLQTALHFDKLATELVEAQDDHAHRRVWRKLRAMTPKPAAGALRALPGRRRPDGT